MTFCSLLYKTNFLLTFPRSQRLGESASHVMLWLQSSVLSCTLTRWQGVISSPDGLVSFLEGFVILIDTWLLLLVNGEELRLWYFTESLLRDTFLSEMTCKLTWHNSQKENLNLRKSNPMNRATINQPASDSLINEEEKMVNQFWRLTSMNPRSSKWFCIHRKWRSVTIQGLDLG